MKTQLNKIILDWIGGDIDTSLGIKELPDKYKDNLTINKETLPIIMHNMLAQTQDKRYENGQNQALQDLRNKVPELTEKIIEEVVREIDELIKEIGEEIK